ncbi:hypothetical protein [Carboxylicivirga sp. RSCT41]|uniref:hypothetical protein n=1 Tax=Carboxylicivirga agarovorans TaxID=3417570 RepID=UPI003D3585DD
MNSSYLNYAVCLLAAAFTISCIKTHTEVQFTGSYLVDSKIIDKYNTNKIIDFLSPMQLENDTMTITQVYDLSIKTDTSIYYHDEFKYAFILGLIFNNDPSNYEILVCYPCDGLIFSTYLINNNADLILAKDMVFMNDFTKIADIACLQVCNPEDFVKMPEDRIKFWYIGGMSTLNGTWIPDTIKQDQFRIDELNNKWHINGDLDSKSIHFKDLENNTTSIDQCYFTDGNLFLKKTDRQFKILTVGRKAIFLYDQEYKLIHRLNRE